MVEGGHTFREVAKALGCSRNAAIAKANRLDIHGPPDRNRPKPVRCRAVRRPKLAEPAAPPEPKRTPLVELRRKDCRYVVAGEGRDAVYCGARAKEGSSWCPFHHDRVFDYLKQPRSIKSAIRDARKVA